MKEFKEIINSYHRSNALGRKLALGAVVHLDGSSYRRPGARMLIDDAGQLTGAISGGCLEGDALRKAMLVIAQQQSKLVTYDTSDEEDASIGVQLGCEGIIQVLFEPIDPGKEIHPIRLLEKAERKRQHYVLVTVFNILDKKGPQIGTCLLMEEDESITGQIDNKVLYESILKDTSAALWNKKSKFIQYLIADRVYTAFIEYVAPPISLLVVGAGNDAIPMVNFGDALGWEVRVVDGRNNLAKAERFVGACQVLVSKPEKVLDQLTMDDQSAVVLMTHNYNYDLAMLRTLLEKNIRYIGTLGPKKKLQKMIDEMKTNGFSPSEEQLSRVYGPVGLEIGAETAEEIALSIIAEIQAVFQNTKGGMLREKQDVIHSRSETSISYNKIKYNG